MLSVTSRIENTNAQYEALERAITSSHPEDGKLYIGYPLISTDDGIKEIDAFLISMRYGVIAYIINAETRCESVEAFLDEIYTKLEAKFKSNSALALRRKLRFQIQVFNYVGKSKRIDSDLAVSDHNIFGDAEEISSLDLDLYRAILSVSQSVSSNGKNVVARNPQRENSKGSILKGIEKQLTVLDESQDEAVLQTIHGVQRIRGLAGSGKTVVLAKKAAILAATTDLRICITFNTRTLKDLFTRLVAQFYLEETGNPNTPWERLRILHAWGSPSSDGVYYLACIENDVKYHDFSSAKSINKDAPFSGACKSWNDAVENSNQLFDLILIDEAQDFDKEFLVLCRKISRDHLVYAYDELQNLTEASMPPPSEIWGLGEDGKPVVELTNQPGKPKRDVILRRCYRNPGLILTTAHGLGFGTARTELVQMFDYAPLWKEIGYEVTSGELADGSKVELKRTHESSPEYLENHSSPDDVIIFKTFKSAQDQAEHVAKEISRNLQADELSYRDIIVITCNPLTSKNDCGIIRRELLDLGIGSNMAGVTNTADVFYSDTEITFSSIYRAKGNEAAMVYVVNSEYCGEGFGLATKRNILFTAMTRTKAWLRVYGVGPAMKSLEKEFSQIKSDGYSLKFEYPPEQVRKRLRVVNRDMSESDKRQIEKSEAELRKLLKSLQERKLHLEDFPEELLRDLRSQLGGK